MQSYLPLITGSGGALVVLALVAYLLGIGKLHPDSDYQRLLDENKDLKAALETERTTNNELARAGGVTTKVLDALVEVATGRHEADRHEHPAALRTDAGLTPQDLGRLCDGGGAAWVRHPARQIRCSARPKYRGSGDRRFTRRSSGRYSNWLRRTSLRVSSGRR